MRFDVTVFQGEAVLTYTCTCCCRKRALEVAAVEFPGAFIRVWGI